MFTYIQYFAILVLGVRLVTSQAISAAATQSTGWNASFELSPKQLKLANLTSDQGAIINTITNFDLSQLANGGAHLAMDIFAHWLVLVMLLDGVWWISDIGEWELGQVVSLMKTQDLPSQSADIGQTWWPETMYLVKRELTPSV